jgi:hypothetical protein
MNFQFNRIRKPEPVESVTVHLWHRQPDKSKVMALKDTMLSTRTMRHARLIVHDDGEQQPGCTVIEGLDCGDFDLKLFRQMVSDILN